ncbi:hypothetical protein L687_01115 [Microbacterium maritypicum MF109]|uniref:Uncharacterized protein n=1 Tax=Microbacterium maritypicum MF109 TaxID=1333857 RepID=T5K5G6_MICMQ|nr:hypothetical protein L687_01115 [Microbacterium maritypicum MF109]
MNAPSVDDDQKSAKAGMRRTSTGLSLIAASLGRPPLPLWSSY